MSVSEYMAEFDKLCLICDLAGKRNEEDWKVYSWIKLAYL